MQKIRWIMSKNKLSKKKKIVIIILVVALLALAGVGLTLYFVIFNPKKNGNQLRAEVNTEKPTYESVLTQNRDDFSSEKDYALYLYESACAAFQNYEKCAYVDDYVTTTSINLGKKLSIPCQGCRFTVKTGTEYYYADYSSADSDVDMLLGWMGKEEDTLFAKRSYADLSKMDYLYTEKVLRPDVNIDDGNLEVNADWSEGNSVDGYPKHEDLPIYYASQEGTFQQTEMNITSETVIGATVTYNSELGYYTVSFILDVNNPKTSEKLIENLRAGMKGGNYTSITKVYQIWDNGYFRQCESLDYASNSWMELKLDFKTYFKYKEEDCDPANYKYFNEAKQNALAESKQ